MLKSRVAAGVRGCGDWLRDFARAGVDFVYPPACPFCQADVEEAVQRATGGVCETCRGALIRTHGRSCLRCGAGIGPNLDPAAGCQHCRDERFAFERVIRLGVYDAELRTACLQAKQRGAEPVAAGLAMILWQCESAAIETAAIDLVAPIPQHWVQRFYRPHNTAETLADILARRLNVPLEAHIVKKTRLTRPQARLTPTERRTNLRNAFAVTDPALVAGTTVLLVDDVMTTGTTAHEAAKVLNKAGAQRVVLAVVARGLGRRGF